MRYLYAVTVIAHRYHYVSETTAETCFVMADSFTEALQLGQDRLTDRELDPGDGWRVVSVKAWAPNSEDVLELAERIKLSQAEADRQLGLAGLARWGPDDGDDDEP